MVTPFPNNSFSLREKFRMRVSGVRVFSPKKFA